MIRVRRPTGSEKWVVYPLIALAFAALLVLAQAVNGSIF